MTIENYITKAKEFFNGTHDLMKIDNHECHNTEDYWDILLGDIKKNPKIWEGKSALDFGCGCGRNLKNLCTLSNWKSIHGCDISKYNADYSYEYIVKYHNSCGADICTWENDGKSVQSLDGLMPNIKYDFIMTTVVLEHIPSYTVRKSILTSIFNSLKDGGLLSLSLQNLGESTSADYYEDCYEFPKNALINNPDAIKKDLKEIGFKDIKVTGPRKNKWRYVRAVK